MPLSVRRCRASTSNFQDLLAAISLEVRQNCGQGWVGTGRRGCVLRCVSRTHPESSPPALEPACTLVHGKLAVSTALPQSAWQRAGTRSSGALVSASFTRSQPSSNRPARMPARPPAHLANCDGVVCVAGVFAAGPVDCQDELCQHAAAAGAGALHEHRLGGDRYWPSIVQLLGRPGPALAC